MKQAFLMSNMFNATHTYMLMSAVKMCIKANNKLNFT